MTLAYAPHAEFRALYETYAAHPDCIGAHLNGHLASLAENDPILVTTGSDIAIFLGGGRPPLTEGFRLSTRGFIELTAISHLGVAVPYLIGLKDAGFAGWEADARRLIDQTRRTQAINSVEYWRNVVAVEAFQGLETKLTAMVDYSCAATIDYLERGLSDPRLMTFDHVRSHFLDSVDPVELPVAMNDMMAATFALVFLDTGYRVIRWLRAQDIDWAKLMVVVCGRAGRPTAGLTWQTNSMCHLLWQATGQKLDPEKLYIAPHAPVFSLDQLETSEGAADVEHQFRKLWFGSRTTVEMGRVMFDGYPAFHRPMQSAPVVDAATRSISELPQVRSEADRRAIITRLRFVMEDPAQQLVNAGAQFVVDQLCAHDNDPSRVVIPGFTNLDYPDWTMRKLGR